MKNRALLRRTLTLAAAAALALSLSLPASALLLGQAEAAPTVAAFSKNGPAEQPIAFSAADFQTEGGELDCIVITSLPDVAAGSLSLGGRSLSVGDEVSMRAVDGLRFTPAAGEQQASFSFAPIFDSGVQGESVTVGLYFLSEENGAPVAERLELNTYKNVAITARLSAVDPEGDLLTFHLLDKPARGAVVLAEDGSGEFTYTPYENKTGKDSFTYVAVDPVGNTSDPATVKIRIEKAGTKVTYADLSGHPAHKAAVRLAQEGVFVGAQVGGEYFFDPDVPVTRGEFVAMAMSAAGVDVLTGVTRTGFADDGEIPGWAKPYASTALKAGLVLGGQNQAGQVVFNANAPITRAEAAVLLDRAFQVTDVSGSLYTETTPAWASQSAANLVTCGIMQAGAGEGLLLEEPLSRGDAAQMLCGALELMDSRNSGGWLPW